jgi:hypothetical protein
LEEDQVERDKLMPKDLIKKKTMKQIKKFLNKTPKEHPKNNLNIL